MLFDKTAQIVFTEFAGKKSSVLSGGIAVDLFSYIVTCPPCHQLNHCTFFCRDHELKVITERINLAERHFNTLLKDFAALSTGLVSLQEKGMKLSKSVDLYSDEEYPSMKASLAGVSENIASLQDFLGAQVKYWNTL